jgi:hypothetical protein
MRNNAKSMLIQKMTSQQTKVYKKQVPDVPNHLNKGSNFFFRKIQFI